MNDLTIGERVSYLTGVRLRVGDVVEVEGDRARVKWDYSQHATKPETRHADGKRTWVAAKKLTRTIRES